MLIVTWFVTSGDLKIDAYTHSRQDFDGVEETLRMASIPLGFQPIPSDSARRSGRRYIAPAAQVGDLELVLQGKFQANGQFIPALGIGNKYACHEISLGGPGSRCENFKAPSKSVALTKCALIAQRNNWFGGQPYPGMCP